MANWCGMSRSNYFGVKDEAKFRTWAKELSLEVITDSSGRFGFYSITDDGGFPSWRHKNDGEDEEIDLANELAPHLAQDEIAVLMEAGHEKARYVSGHAIAVNSRGQCVSLALSDIYARAAETFGVAVAAINEGRY